MREEGDVDELWPDEEEVDTGSGEEATPKQPTLLFVLPGEEQ